jgi:hypothetical protein
LTQESAQNAPRRFGELALECFAVVSARNTCSLRERVTPQAANFSRVDRDGCTKEISASRRVAQIVHFD